MRKCIVEMKDPVIGDFFMCKRCKHFMLSKVTAELHRRCKSKLFATFKPKEEIYRCSTCGRYFDTKEEWSRHEAFHMHLGNYDPTKFSFRTDQKKFIAN